MSTSFQFRDKTRTPSRRSSGSPPERTLYPMYDIGGRIFDVLEDMAKLAVPLVGSFEYIFRRYMQVNMFGIIGFVWYQKFFQQGAHVTGNFITYLLLMACVCASWIGCEKALVAFKTAALSRSDQRRDQRGVTATTVYDFVPISSLAIALLRWLSTAMALYLIFVVLLNLEVLVLLPLVVKQRAYSFIYLELSSPRMGPVFMTQMKQLGIMMLDGFFAPWTWFGGMLGRGFVSSFRP